PWGGRVVTVEDPDGNLFNLVDSTYASRLTTPSTDDAKKIEALIDASLPPLNADHRSGKLDEAEQILRENPELRAANIYTACVLGDVKRVAAFLEQDPKLATTPGGSRNWPPILYVCFSRFMRLQPK